MKVEDIAEQAPNSTFIGSLSGLIIPSLNLVLYLKLSFNTIPFIGYDCEESTATFFRG